MQQTNDKPTVLFMLVVMAFAIILVDDRWVRAGLGLLPALLLAQRALMGSGLGQARGEDASDGNSRDSERRADNSIREQIQELLKLIREFYTTCHMVAVGQLEPAKAKAKAQIVERKLNTMMGHMLERIESEGGDA